MTKVISVEEMLQKVHLNNILIEQQKQLSGISKPRVNELRIVNPVLNDGTNLHWWLKQKWVPSKDLTLTLKTKKGDKEFKAKELKRDKETINIVLTRGDKIWCKAWKSK